MGLLDSIKNDIKKSGKSKSKILYFKAGVKVRIRFLSDMEDGLTIPFHDNYTLGINVPCQDVMGRECEHCGNDELRHRDLYGWPVWDYEAKEVKIILAPVNSASPIPALVGMFETYGTLLDRDYVITKNGSGTSTTYSVVPMDKVRFKNKDAKPYSESKMLAIIDKAFPDDSNEEEETPVKKKSKKKSKPSKPIEGDEGDEDDDYEEEDEKPKKGKKKPSKTEEDYEDSDTEDYEDMSAKELYNLCKKKGIKVKPKMDEEYYIEKLMDNDDEEEGDEDNDW